MVQKQTHYLIKEVKKAKIGIRQIENSQFGWAGK
jgi:hypothetical protein